MVFLSLILFIASYYRQLSATGKMRNFQINSNFVSPEGPKDWPNKAGIDNIISRLLFIENCL